MPEDSASATSVGGVERRLNEIPPRLRQLARKALDYLTPRLDNVFSGAVDVLFETASEAENEEERSRFFDAAHTLRTRGKECRNFFFDDFLVGFTPESRDPRKKRQTRSGSSLSEVGILAGEDFDLSVAVSMVTSRSAAENRAYLDQLTSAISTLGDGPGLTAGGNPLGVFRITASFMTAVARLKVEVWVQRLLLNLFETEVMVPLGELYADSCTLLQIAVPGEGAADSPTPAIAPDATAYDGSPGIARGHGDTTGTHQGGFYELQSLIRSRRDLGRPTAAGTPRQGKQGTVSPRMLSEAFSGAISSAMLSDHAQATSLTEMAAAALNRTGASIDDVEDDALDVLQLVSLLFEHLLANEDLSSPIASQISRLQIPVLKVGLVDSALFDDPEHVARQVINQIAEIGIGWSGDAERLRRDPTFAQIDRIVGRIVEECHSNLSVFETANKELAEVRSVHFKRVASTEQRLNQRAASKAKVQAAKAVVQDFLNSTIVGVRLPPAISNFVRQHWSQVLVYLCVRHGLQSEAWQEATSALDELLVLGQPAQSEPEIQVRAQRTPILLKQLTHWCEVAGTNSASLNSTITMVGRSLDELSQHDQAALTQDLTYEVQELDEVECIELLPADEPASAAIDPEDESLLAGLSIGSWVEVTQSEEQVFRWKLSMILEQSRNYLFVDHRGLRVDEIPGRKVAEQLRDGRMRQLAAGPVFEDALDRVIDNLQQPAWDWSSPS